MSQVDYTNPIFDTEVFAVRGNRGQVFLGYGSDPDGWMTKALELGDGWSIVERPCVEQSILDEWTGRDVEIADYGSVSYETFGINDKWGTPQFRKRRAKVV